MLAKKLFLKMLSNRKMSVFLFSLHGKSAATIRKLFTHSWRFHLTSGRSNLDTASRSRIITLYSPTVVLK